MSPFKLKKKYVKFNDLFSATRHYFGDLIAHGEEGIEWKFEDVYLLRVNHIDGEEVPNISITEHGSSEDLTFEKLPAVAKDFINEVKKPWSEWLDEEFFEEPMWIFLLSQDGELPEKFHNYMAMASYEFPENYWIKKYFKKN